MPKKIDEIGNIYGRLTVIKEATIEERGILTGGAYWWCKCECGNIKMINGHSLRSGKTTSCGCLNKEIVSIVAKKNIHDIANNRYGRLLVIKRDFDTNKKDTKWICKCDCGNIVSVLANSLTQGKTTSCGCVQREVASNSLSITASNNFINEEGNVYGRLTVIEKSQESFPDDLKGVYWLCKCNCRSNNIVRVRGVDLRKGHVQSCGCLHSCGEFKIRGILSDNKIAYIPEYSFDDLYGKSERYLLRFDFGIVNDQELLYLIEFHGRQHFEITEYMGGKKEFLKRQEYDLKKIDYCRSNNIPLIAIPYTQYSGLCINDLVLETTKFRTV